jgi:hypothetical protein
MTEAELRAGIRDALRSLNAVAEAAISRELAGPIDLGHSERLQFEACPNFFGVKLVQTEEEILPDSAIQDVIPPELWAAAEAVDLSVFEAVEAELPAWLAERWQAAGGPLPAGVPAVPRRAGRAAVRPGAAPLVRGDGGLAGRGVRPSPPLHPTAGAHRFSDRS